MNLVPAMVTVRGSRARTIRRMAGVLLLLATPASAALPPWSIQLLYGHNEIFPAILATVTESGIFPPRYPEGRQLGDPTGLIAAEIVAPADGYRVEVVVGATAIFGRSSIEVTLPRRGETYRVAPFLVLNHEAIHGLRHPIARELLDVAVRSGADLQTKTLAVRIWAVTDCVFYLRAPSWLREQRGFANGRMNDWLDTHYLAAAFINENNVDVIPAVIRHALDQGYINHFTGYATGRPHDVRAQVRAVYSAMHDLGFRYSLLYKSTSDMGGSEASTQRIRLAGDTVGARQANCIDGSALMAGILTRVGLHASVYITPNHAFLVVDLDPAGRTSMGVETTLVSSWRSFDRAVTEGEEKRLAVDQPADPGQRSAFSGVAAESLAERAGGRVFRIAVSAARANGILSIIELPSPQP